MAPSASRTERCNANDLDGSQHKPHCNQGDLFLFPGFVVNNKNDVDCTPIAKIPCGTVLNCTNSAKSTDESSSTAATKTPPVEPSVSPEIQSTLCRSVFVSGAAPSACYGAGHVLSGVTDKRKCKARGILSVGHKKPLEWDIPEDNVSCASYDKKEQGLFRKSRPSFIPFPAEASISWHLSPSYVDEDHGVLGEGNHQKGLHQSLKIVEPATVHLPSSLCGSPPCMVSHLEHQGLLEYSSDKVVNTSSSISLCETPHHKHVISQEERISSFDAGCSPFSAESLSSGNVMQTPNSDSSLERHWSLSWLKKDIHVKHQFESELDQVTDVLQHESLSSMDKLSPWDPPTSSLELSDLCSPSDLTNLNHFRPNSDSHASWISSSTTENVSESQIRISWRDGLLSGTFDKDDLDCCRLLSDEEMDTDGVLKSPQFLEQEVRADGNGKETLSPTLLNPCAESMRTDDGGLIASGDSDWTVYYKNPPFKI